MNAKKQERKKAKQVGQVDAQSRLGLLVRAVIITRTAAQHLWPVPVVPERIPMYSHRRWEIRVQHTESLWILRNTIDLVRPGFHEDLDQVPVHPAGGLAV